VLSRTHPGLLMKLFEMEVPEIYEGIVRIEACAREPGFRAKIAVSTTDRTVDPVGTCVGVRGARVQAVVAELRGEAVDIIPWSEDPAQFVLDAISPAKPTGVYIDEGEHRMELIVPDDQLAKAIGRRGQNVRLADHLTGWKLDIRSESKHSQMMNVIREEISRIGLLDDEQVEILLGAGFQAAQEIADANPGEIADMLEVDEDFAEKVISAADQVVEAMIMEEASRRRGGGGDARR
jgi:N utilization substance protein A